MEERGMEEYISERRVVNVVRIYKCLLGTMLFLIGALVIFDHELGVKSLQQVDFIIGIGLIIASFLAIVSSVVDEEWLYQVSYIFTTISLSTWTFVLLVYAVYNLTPWGRVVAFAYILAQNCYMLPHLMADRKADRTLTTAGRELQRARESIAESGSEREQSEGG